MKEKIFDFCRWIGAVAAGILVSTLGQPPWLVYRFAARGRNFQGAPLPKWFGLDRRGHRAWAAVGAFYTAQIVLIFRLA